MPQPRMAVVRRLTDGKDQTIDQALVLWFPGPATATGEDIAELHLHGGRAVVAAVLARLAGLPGLRPAAPGEFTRRAFAHGLIDLAQAEALGDLLAAETEAQRRNAVMQFEGGLAHLIGGWVADVVALAATVEAGIDFSDEDDVDSIDLPGVTRAVSVLADAIAENLEAPPAERLRDGLRIVIAGAPNAGKSTLLNALVGREAAIATPIAGTTRDLIEVPVVLQGVALVIVDTAGLRTGPVDIVEAIGINRAQAAIATADLVIALDDDVISSAPTIRVSTKSDLGLANNGLAVSGKTGDGLSALRSAIVKQAHELLPRPDRLALNARHRNALSAAVTALRAIADQSDLLIIAEQLRHARAALDRVTGAGDVEAVLDSIFARFCIGK